MRSILIAALLFALGLAACGEQAMAPLAAGVGPDPALPEPRQGLLPTLSIAPAKGWGAGEMPLPAERLSVTAFAQGLDHPRWLHVLPNGDVLVAETNKQPAQVKSVKGFIEKQIMRIAGAEAPTGSRSCATQMATGWPKRGRCCSTV